MDSRTTSRPTSDNDAISEIRNDPDVYMEIRPTRNSNACASCRKKKKKCELGPNGANTTCKRCSDYGIECKYYERTPGDQATSSTPDVTAPPSPPAPRNHPASPGLHRPWPTPGGTTNNNSSVHSMMPFSSPNSVSMQTPGDRGDVFPLANPYTPERNNRETNALYPSASHTNPYQPIHPAAPQYTNQFSAGNNPFPRNNQGIPMAGIADQITSTACECTPTFPCSFHMPQWPTPPNPTSSRSGTSLQDWNPSYYPKNI